MSNRVPVPGLPGYFAIRDDGCVILEDAERGLVWGSDGAIVGTAAEQYPPTLADLPAWQEETPSEEELAWLKEAYDATPDPGPRAPWNRELPEGLMT